MCGDAGSGAEGQKLTMNILMLYHKHVLKKYIYVYMYNNSSVHKCSYLLTIQFMDRVVQQKFAPFTHSVCHSVE